MSPGETFRLGYGNGQTYTKHVLAQGIFALQRETRPGDTDSVVETVERIWIQAGRALVQTRSKTSL